MKNLTSGFTYSENNDPWTTEDWLYQRNESTKDKAVFYGYDANMFPLPDFSRWDKKHQKKVIEHALTLYSEFDGEIWLDDVKIKEKK